MAWNPDGDDDPPPWRGGFRGEIDVTDQYAKLTGKTVVPEAPKTIEEEHPIRVTTRIAVCSSETAVARRYTIWDVNGYYRALGFSWPYLDISKAMLRTGYQEVIGPGQDQGDPDRLTYILKFLLNDSFRAYYDARAFGDPIFDRYLDAAIKRAAKAEVARRRASGDYESTTDEVMDGWGLQLLDGDGDDVAFESPEISEESGGGRTFHEWAWGFYLWRSDKIDLDVLSRWQELLVAEFAARGIRQQFAVGFLGRQPHRALPVRVQGDLVVLLHENVEPTQYLAANVADSSMTTGEVA